MYQSEDRERAARKKKDAAQRQGERRRWKDSCPSRRIGAENFTPVAGQSPVGGHRRRSGKPRGPDARASNGIVLAATCPRSRCNATTGPASAANATPAHNAVARG
ncbi:unnamed protein product [Urochloa humidicola]